MARKVVAAVNRLRDLDLDKPPGVAETIDWVQTLTVLGLTTSTPAPVDDSLGTVIKVRDDLDVVLEHLDELAVDG